MTTAKAKKTTRRKRVAHMNVLRSGGAVQRVERGGRVCAGGDCAFECETERGRIGDEGGSGKEVESFEMDEMRGKRKREVRT